MRQALTAPSVAFMPFIVFSIVCVVGDAGCPVAAGGARARSTAHGRPRGTDRAGHGSVGGGIAGMQARDRPDAGWRDGGWRRVAAYAATPMEARVQRQDWAGARQGASVGGPDEKQDVSRRDGSGVMRRSDVPSEGLRTDTGYAGTLERPLRTRPGGHQRRFSLS